MIKALLRASILALVLVLGASPAHAQRPDPHRSGPATDRPAPTVVAGSTPADAGCGLVTSYSHDLFEAIGNSGTFADFFTSDVDFGDVSASEAEAIIRDGDALIETLRGLDVPPAYADAHAGIIVFLQFQIDTASFFGLDSSEVPDIAAQNRAFDAIEAGEVAIAEACPDAIEEVGGYILLEPSEGPEVTPDPNNPAN